MSVSLLDIQSVVGIPLPYVFVERIRINKSNLRHGDYSSMRQPLVHIKNKFGTNKVVVSDETKNKKYFSNNNVYSVELDIFLNDFLVKNMWYNKGITKNLSVTIIQSSHPLLTEQIIDNNTRDISGFEEKYKKFLQKQVLTIPTNRLLASYGVKLMEGTGDTLCSIPLTTKFIVNSQHLTYFLFVNSPNAHLQSYRTVERVMEGNKPKQKSSIFYSPDNNVYSGPVHYNPRAGWMVGPRHTNKTHSSLRKVDHTNLKIQDYRIFSDLKKIQNSINLSSSPENKNRIFSELYLSRDKNRAARGLFVFDCAGYLASNGRYGKILRHADIDKIMPHMRIKELRIVRKRQEEKKINDYDFIDQAEQYDLVAVSGDRRSRNLLLKKPYYIDLNKDGKLDTLVGAVSEKRLINLGNKRAFTFYDSHIRDFESGKYGYGVEMVIEDPTIKYFSIQVDNLRKAHTMLSEYYNFVNKKNYFTSDGKIKVSFLEVIKQRYNLGPRVGEASQPSVNAPWRKSVRIYMKVLKNLTGRGRESLKNNLYSLLAPVSRDLRGVEIFLSIIENLILKLTKDDVTGPRNEKESTSHGYNKGSHLLYLNKYFDNTFHADTVKDYGIDFYGGGLRYNLDGLATISIGQLLQRFALKGKKSNKRVPTASPGLEPEKFYSRITPISVDLTGNSFDFSTSFNEDNKLDYYLAHVRRLKIKNNSAARSVSIPVQEAIVDKDTDSIQGLIAKAYSEHLALSGDGAVFESETETGATQEEDKIDPSVPGDEDDKFNTTSQDAERDKEEEKEKQSEVISQDIGFYKMFFLASKTEEGEAPQDIYGKDSSVSVSYGTTFDKNLDLGFVGFPYNAKGSYLVLLGADSEGKNVESEDVYDSVVLVTPTDQSSSSQDDKEFLGNPDVEQEKIAFQQEDSVPLSQEDDKEPPRPPPEEDLDGESGEVSDSDSDIYYSIGYTEEVQATEEVRRTGPTRSGVTVVPPTPSPRAEGRQAYVRGVRPRRTGGTTMGGDGGY
jgi:hypothetical protein